MPAKIIGAALEQRDLRRQSQGSRQQRDIAAKQLILQGARARGDDHATPRQKRRDQIGKGLTRPRAGFDDQGFQTRQREAHGRCHRGLFGAIRIARQSPRQRTLEAENIFVVAVH